MLRYLAVFLMTTHLLVACKTTNNFEEMDPLGYDLDDRAVHHQKAGSSAKDQKCKVIPNTTATLSSPQLEIPGKIKITGFKINSNQNQLLLQTEKDIRVWDLQQGQQRHVKPRAAGLKFEQQQRWPQGQIKLSLNQQQGNIEVYSDKQDRLLADIWLTEDSWLVVDSHGRFDADMQSWQNFRWHNQSAGLNFVQLADMYFEPALLGKLAVGAKLDTPNAVPIQSALPLPPESNLNVQLNEQGSQITGQVQVKKRGGCIGKVRVFQNGKAIPVKPPSTRKADSDTEVWTFSAPVPPGKNNHVFRALATTTQKIEGQPVVSEIKVRPQSSASAKAHILVIAIDKYANPMLDLSFAVADGEGIVKWAQAMRPDLNVKYDQIAITRLYNQDATRARIIQELEKLQSVDPQDTVLIYLAGHGENDGVRWFFLPSEFGKEISLKAVTAEGVSSKVLQQSLVKIPAQQIGVIVDACKSGGLSKMFAQATDSRYLEWVSRTSGVHILAATDHQQLAAELSQLGHGAMTYTILQGLSGKSDRVPADKVITARELFHYTEKNLPDITMKVGGISQYPLGFYYGPDFVLDHLE